VTAPEGTPRARRILAPNPSPMTLTGTNTWLIAEPGATEAMVVDPGPSHPGHLQRVQDEAAAAGQRVTWILLTHSHPDHAAGAAALAAATGAPVLAADPRYQRGDEGLPPGAVIDSVGCELHVIPTPGHTADSVSLHLPADQALLTGDTILGQGTTVIAEDGDLADYLETLTRLQDLTAAADLRVLLPGHGPVLTTPAETLDYYAAHRQERLSEIRAALAGGDRTPTEIIARVYTGIDPALHRFATWSVQAQLRYLRDRGELPPDMK